MINERIYYIIYLLIKGVLMCLQSFMVNKLNASNCECLG